MRFRHLHTTILRSSQNRTRTTGQPQNTSHLFVPPANKPPARPKSNNFTHSDIVKCTVAIRNHMRNGQCDAALRLFNSMPRKNEVTYGTMISGYFSNGEFKLAQQLFDEMPVKNLVTRTIMIKGNIKNNSLEAARRVFDDMPVKDVFSWNTILSGYVQNGLMDEAKRVFHEMPVKNVVSWTMILCGYVQNGLLDEAKRVFHEMPAKDVFSWNTILSGYAQNGLMEEATKVFDEMPMKDVVSWNTILSGYMHNGLLEDAKRVFDEMSVKNVVSWTTILSGYMQNGLMDEARRVFDEMPHRNSISWAAMIAGYSQNGDSEEALRFFIEAMRDWERLSTCAFACVLSTCADIATFELGKQIQGRVVKGGFEFNCYVGSALVLMYCRCGSIEEAYDVFERIEDKNVISWSTIINGYARHGFGQEALQHFESMKQASIQPDEVTMVGVLTACSHMGLVDKGKHYFYSMSQDHGIVPNIYHYSCMIDLLGRAGRLEEAQNLMKSMPFEPDAATWGSLLGASRIHGNIELGEKAAEMLFDLEPWSSSVYVHLSNLYAASGRWEDVKKMRLRTRDRGLNIRPGYSWVEVLNKVHTFCVGDFTHPDSESIYAFLEELDLRMKEDGYVSSTKSVLHDVEEEEKQHTLKFHSERLAVAYGIMKIPSGRPVRVFKNLRVCEDCHMAIKHIAKLAGRLVILRDVNRFHHFEGEFCPVLAGCLRGGGGLVAYADLVHDHKEARKKRVLMLGTGWAGISFLKDLDISSYGVQVVSRRNYFALTPLLPSVTCGTVEARSIVVPVRNIVKKRNREIKFWEAECLKVDAMNKKVICRSNANDNLTGNNEFSLKYDYLVIAVGAQVNTFNTPGVLENCYFLKEVEDAQSIRRAVIDCFEKAVPDLTEEERKINLHFVIVGGGPTGVEFAAELHDFIYEDLVKIYPSVKDLVAISLIQSGDHILNTYDERISSFAEQKFQRDGIEVLTGHRVLSVSDRMIDVKVKSTGMNVSIPHGMVVWSTGVGTRPIVKDFMEQIGQSNRKVLATDEWLRVKGCDDVYGLGDCTTVDQKKIEEDISAIFAAGNKDNSGTLTIEEFKDVIEDVSIRYPQVELYLQNNHLSDITELLKDADGNEREEVDIEEFKLALSNVDKQTKSLPATAQVAAQQGAYLARCFNMREKCQVEPEGPRKFRSGGRHEFRPFRYRHLGQFVPLGGEQAAAELPGDWVSVGHSTQWLWYSIYASKQVSWRTRYLVVGDWTRRFIFGRDSSRI